MVVYGWLLIVLAIMTFASFTIWIAGRRDGDLIRFFAELNFHQHEMMTALTLSAMSFLILGLAIGSMPS